MNSALRAFVRERARRRCEYCCLHEDDADFLSFHVEHFIAKQHRGTDDPDGLCYACADCNWAKGPNLVGILDGQLYPLFNPRKQKWHRHFRWDLTLLAGRTKSGEVTVQVLNINKPGRVQLRDNLLFEGRFPPKDE